MPGQDLKISCGATLLDVKHPLSYGEITYRYTSAFVYGAPTPSRILGVAKNNKAFQLALESPFGITFLTASHQPRLSVQKEVCLLTLPHRFTLVC